MSYAPGPGVYENYIFDLIPVPILALHGLFLIPSASGSYAPGPGVISIFFLFLIPDIVTPPLLLFFNS
mgnify:CR=1 FL=1